MQLTPSDIYAHYRPSKCGLRLYLRENSIEAAPLSPYVEVLQRLGHRHERDHLSTFPAAEDLSGLEVGEELFERTRTAVTTRTPVVYQPLLRGNLKVEGVNCEIIGRPDFLIQGKFGYHIRDSKMSCRITAKDHPEIILQLQTYGWLFEQMFEQRATHLEVHNGPGEIIDIPYDGSNPVVEALREIVRIRSLLEEPYSPVGLSKCGSCGYYDRCWRKAEENRDVALVGGVDKDLAFALHQLDVLTMDQLLERFDEESLAEVTKKRGTKLVRVGNAALSILRNARALSTGTEALLSNPDIPAGDNYVMFDLEGLPPHLDELQKVYLWGLQVFGTRPSDYISSTAGFGIDGDRQGWEEFLEKASKIFELYGDIRFVHWATYEQTLISMYVRRFGDASGVAARVKNNLLNLLPITERSIVLPLPGYGLKVIERYIGFSRTQDEYGGNWSMAKYIEAVETDDEQTRNRLMEAIRTYNREDLEATWAVMKWLMSKTTKGNV